LPLPRKDGGGQSVLKGAVLAAAGCQATGVKNKKSKKERDKATLARITKEMAEPRFAESTREEAAGIAGVRERGSRKHPEYSRA